jgi:hypothetical protein
MNEHPIQPGGSDLPHELREIADALDQLGELDRGAPGASFERRMAIATAPGQALEPHRLSALADAERQAAPATLEDRIFIATRSLLHTPSAAAPSLKVHTRRPARMLRAAAALTLVATAALSYIAMRPTPSPLSIPLPSAGESGPVATAQLEDDFAGLAVILNVALGSSDSDTSVTSSTAETLDTATFDLPRFDFLNAELEGSL